MVITQAALPELYKLHPNENISWVLEKLSQQDILEVDKYLSTLSESKIIWLRDGPEDSDDDKAWADHESFTENSPLADKAQSVLLWLHHGSF